MKVTDDIIKDLSNEINVDSSMPAPAYWNVRLLSVLLFYAALVQLFLGFRTDLWMQFSRPLFTLEITLQLLLLVSSTVACVLSMYPDAYQKTWFLSVPYAVFLAQTVFLLLQLLMPQDARMVMPEPSTHAMECAICIASVALVPSAMIFAILQKGASVRPWRAGAYAVLAASAIGCLTLRLSEANDSIAHLLYWHYLPTVIFATVGAWLGRYLLKW